MKGYEYRKREPRDGQTVFLQRGKAKPCIVIYFSLYDGGTWTTDRGTEIDAKPGHVWASIICPDKLEVAE